MSDEGVAGVGATGGWCAGSAKYRCAIDQVVSISYAVQLQGNSPIPGRRSGRSHQLWAAIVSLHAGEPDTRAAAGSGRSQSAAWRAALP